MWFPNCSLLLSLLSFFSPLCFLLEVFLLLLTFLYLFFYLVWTDSFAHPPLFCISFQMNIVRCQIAQMDVWTKPHRWFILEQCRCIRSVDVKWLDFRLRLGLIRKLIHRCLHRSVSPAILLCCFFSSSAQMQILQHFFSNILTFFAK